MVTNNKEQLLISHHTRTANKVTMVTNNKGLLTSHHIRTANKVTMVTNNNVQHLTNHQGRTIAGNCSNIKISIFFFRVLHYKSTPCPHVCPLCYEVHKHNNHNNRLLPTHQHHTAQCPAAKSWGWGRGRVSLSVPPPGVGRSTRCHPATDKVAKSEGEAAHPCHSLFLRKARISSLQVRK